MLSTTTTMTRKSEHDEKHNQTFAASAGVALSSAPGTETDVSCEVYMNLNALRTVSPVVACYMVSVCFGLVVWV